MFKSVPNPKELLFLAQPNQEAQLPQGDSVWAMDVFQGWLTDRAIHWTPQLLYNYIQYIQYTNL